jgi:hypothetical protein
MGCRSLHSRARDENWCRLFSRVGATEPTKGETEESQGGRPHISKLLIVIVQRAAKGENSDAEAALPDTNSSVDNLHQSTSAVVEASNKEDDKEQGVFARAAVEDNPDLHYSIIAVEASNKEDDKEKRVIARGAIEVNANAQAVVEDNPDLEKAMRGTNSSSAKQNTNAVVEAWHERKAEEEEEGDSQETCLARVYFKVFKRILHPFVLNISATTVANGGDNVAVYVPLFAAAPVNLMPEIIIIFYVLLLVWCAASYSMLQCRCFAEMLTQYGGQFVPWLLIGLGLYILSGSIIFHSS